jgi:hypothetical protein
LATLLHLSLFLFFVGLVIYLFNVNHLVFGTVVWWVILSKMAYLSISLFPSFPPSSPFAWKQASEIDVRVLQSTLDALDEAGAQEEFFGAIPGFFESELVNGLNEHLTDDFRAKFSEALNRFLDHTLSLSSVSGSVRSRRLVICLDAARAALGFDGVSQIFQDILNGRWPELIQSVEVVQSLRQWSNEKDERFTQYVKRIVAQAVVDVLERDDRWISLVKAEFDVPDHVIQSYITHENSVLLSILIHVTRQAFHTGFWTPWVLSSLSGFSIHDTLPGLQHAFCALWNDILFKARDQEEGNTYVEILREIRGPYIDLHRDTDAAPTFPADTHFFNPVLVQPWFYRHCNIASHRRDLTVRTPVPSPAIIPSSTQLNEPPGASPLPSPLGRHHTPGGNTVTLEPSADRAPRHPQELTGPSPTADPMHILTQAPSSSGSSDCDSVRTAITWDPDRLVPEEASAPSAAEIAVTNSGDMTPQIDISELGEISQAPEALSLIFRHPNPVTATVIPFTGPGPGEDRDALQDTTSCTTLSHPPEGNKQQGSTAPCAAPDASEILFEVDPNPWSILVVPPIVVSDSTRCFTTTACPQTAGTSVDVLHPNGDSDGEETWPHTDIEAVRAVRHEDVFWDHEAERVDERCANMLFYRRTSPTETR